MRDLDASPRTLARRLRASAPVAEQLLWSRLRRRQLRGYKFRRQHPIGPFIADFACLEARLVVEVDGPTHCTESRQAADRERTQFLNSQGWRVARIWNQDVYRNLDEAVEAIALHLPPSPACGRTSPASGGGIGDAARPSRG